MRLQMLIVTAFTCTCAAGVAAQSASSASPQGKGSSDATVRVTGCIERADQVMPLGGAALGTTVDSLEFVLIRAQVAGSEPSAATPAPTGTAGVAGAAATSKPDDPGQMYRLDGATALLNPQVGHRVEISGSRDTTSTSADARVDATNPTAATAPLLRVSSVKMIAETCPK